MKNKLDNIFKKINNLEKELNNKKTPLWKKIKLYQNYSF